MLKRKINLSFSLLIFVIIGGFAYSSFAERKIIKIAAGSVLEGYYSIGLKLCRYITAANDGIKCEVVPTSGTLENIALLEQGEVDFAFAQSNLAADAYNSAGYFAGKKLTKNLYQLLRLHDEIFTVIVKDRDKIFTFAELAGKKFSNGLPQSDSSIPYLILAENYDFKAPPIDIELNHEEYGKEFCQGNIDAIIMMTGHPNALVNYITHSCESDFVTIEKEKIDLLLKNHPGFVRATLQKGEYPGITQDYDTVAVTAIFVTNNAVDPQLVKNFINYFKGKEEAFKLSHPILYDLDNNHFTGNFILPSFN